jgi:very-short-patch-repair endonuclease
MKVFSTLRSEQIDITRTSSEGVAGIKAFLEYTEKGKIALPNKQATKKEETGYFEKLVEGEIKKMGYSVQTNIGCSGYRIDIGVVNPDKPSEYILGILTDGKTYRAAKTAKDREIVQPTVLKMLGWNIYNLWSLDWWDNPQKVTQDIVRVIKELQESQKTNKEIESQNETQVQKGNDLSSVKLQSITQEVIEPIKNSEEYIICVLDQSDLSISDDFFNYDILYDIKQQITKVLEIEAPISHSLLSKRVLNAWGISRLGIRLNGYLSSIYSEMELKQTSQDGNKFYWNKDQDPLSNNTYRVPVEGDPKRNAEDLPKEEIICGIKDVLSNQVSLPNDDLIREVARLFGYTRLGGNVEQAMRMGIDYALLIGLMINKDDRFVLS